MNLTFIWTLFNAILILAGIAGFAFFVIVMIKLNKALDIWLKQNKPKE